MHVRRTRPAIIGGFGERCELRLPGGTTAARRLIASAVTGASFGWAAASPADAASVVVVLAMLALLAGISVLWSP